jgi:hypothetical protein
MQKLLSKDINCSPNLVPESIKDLITIAQLWVQRFAYDAGQLLYRTGIVKSAMMYYVS